MNLGVQDDKAMKYATANYLERATAADASWVRLMVPDVRWHAGEADAYSPRALRLRWQRASIGERPPRPWCRATPSLPTPRHGEMRGMAARECRTAAPPRLPPVWQLRAAPEAQLSS